MPKKSPPAVASWILEHMLDFNIRYSAMGDFEERYRIIIEESGLFKARMFYWAQILFIFPALFKSFIYWRTEMIKNYLKIAFRNIKRHKGYSFINIIGLAIGMACCFIIVVYLIDELNYDVFHSDSESLYRLVRKMPDVHGPSTRNPMAPALKENFPEIDLAIRTWQLRDPYTFRIEERGFQQGGILFTDKDIFRLFTYKFIHGDSENPLENPFSVVLTKSVSQKYFGMQNPVGKTLSFDGEFDLSVTAVIEDVPHNSHLQFAVVLPMEGFNKIAGYIYGYDASSYSILDAWNAGMFHTYLKLYDDANPESLEQKFPAFLKKYAPYNKELLDETLYLQSVRDIHLFSQYTSSMDKTSNIKFIYVFIAIGLVILLMSCFNYINLATARFSVRTKEIGIRKVVGANRKQLVGQLLMESSIFTLVAFVFSFVLIAFFAPVMNDIIGFSVSLDSFSKYSIIALVFLTGLLAALLSGSYPALFFSAFQTVNAIEDKVNLKTRGKDIRSIFVTFQFSISIILLIGAGLIYTQVRYMKSKDLGYTKEQIIVVAIKDDEVRERSETIKQELLQIPGITRVSFSAALPNKFQRSTTIDLDIDGERKVFELTNTTVDHDFLDLYKIDMVQGRNFSRDYPSDIKGAVLLNESAVEAFNLDNPIGKELRIFGTSKVIGVVQDFNFQSLHSQINPLSLRISGDPYMFASISFSTQNIQENLQSIEKTFKKFVPQRAFEYFFFNDYFANLYRAEENFGKSIGYFSLLTIIVSSLGLFGLAFFIVEQRTKEIGIRKVLGASVPRIMATLSKEFVRWALLANIIAWPVAYLTTHKWLQNFAYRVNIELWIFALSGALVLVIALATVSFQSVKAAMANPVDSLRYE